MIHSRTFASAAALVALDAGALAATTSAFRDLCLHQGLGPDVQDAATAKVAVHGTVEKWRKLVTLSGAKAN